MDPVSAEEAAVAAAAMVALEQDPVPVTVAVQEEEVVGVVVPDQVTSDDAAAIEAAAADIPSDVEAAAAAAVDAMNEEDVDGDLVQATDLAMLRFETTQKKYYKHFLEQLSELKPAVESDPDPSQMRDVRVYCSDGHLDICGVFLAGVSPIFKSCGYLISVMEPGASALVLPDVERADLISFFERLFDYDDEVDDSRFDGDEGKEIMEALDRVLDVLCMDFTGVPDTIESLFYSFGGIRIPKRPGRRRKKRERTEDGGYMGHGVFEPYVKMEILDQPRTDTNYALRNVIKKKKYADEVSTEQAGMSDSEKEDISDDEDSDEFDPEVIDIDEPDDEYDEGDDEGVMEDSSTDEEAELLMMEENMDYDDDLFDPDDDYKDVKPRFRKRRNQLMDPSLDPEGEEPDAITAYNVKITEAGLIEIFDPAVNDKLLGENGAEEEEDEAAAAGENAIKLKMEEPSTTGEIARVVAVMDDVDKLPFKGLELLLTACEKCPARILQKPIGNRPVSLLFCSVCENAFSSLKDLKHHVAKEHPGNRFFTFPRDNPHRNCAPCLAMMQSYENLIKMDPDVQLADVVFPCPHCRRRYVGHLGGLANHLNNDHRHAIESQLLNDAHYFDVFLQHDAKVAICEFCSQDCGQVDALNKHLISCQDNTCGHSAGLFCSICGKMFTQTKNLKGHLIRHGRDKLGRPRDKYCSYCPVACTTDAALQRHMDREHEDQNPDEGFVLHANCLRCAALWSSYMSNKMRPRKNSIPTRHLAFKCPHCCTVLYGHAKHAPRYIYNHVNRFHTDPQVNDFTMGGLDDSAFAVVSKKDPELLKCEFCGHQSSVRCNHNAHLSVCKKSTVPCKPGYMCDTCGFIAGTGRHLRDHLDTHNDPKQFSSVEDRIKNIKVERSELQEEPEPVAGRGGRILSKEPRVLWERHNPLTNFTDEEFHRNFRFTKHNMLKVVDLIKEDIQFASARGSPLTPMQQVTLTLSMFASGNFQHVSGFLAGVKKSCACKTARRVAVAIVNKSPALINMPTQGEMRKSADALFARFGIPNAPLGVDGTHVRLGKKPSNKELPPGLTPRDFFARNQFYSINVQVVCDENQYIRDLETRWAGSTHDARVWRNCSAKQVMEQQQEFTITGDLAYPMSRTLMKPYPHPQTQSQLLFNRSVMSLRNYCTANTVALWKGRFPALKEGFRTKLENTMLFIRALGALHNLGRQFKDPLPDGEVPEVVEEAEDPWDVEEQDQPASEAASRMQGSLYRDTILEQYFNNPPPIIGAGAAWQRQQTTTATVVAGGTTTIITT